MKEIKFHCDSSGRIAEICLEQIQKLEELKLKKIGEFDSISISKELNFDKNQWKISEIRRFLIP